MEGELPLCASPTQTAAIMLHTVYTPEMEGSDSVFCNRYSSRLQVMIQSAGCREAHKFH